MTKHTGLSIIKEFEGLRLKAYLCPAGIPTIGYGETKGVKLGQTITAKQAEDMLVRRYDEFERQVLQLVKVPLTANQLGALVSFTYNVGVGAFAGSTLLKKLNAGDFAGAAQQFERWNKAGGKVLTGLVRRRAAEAALFQKR